jgi:hypothetical protein
VLILAIAPLIVRITALGAAALGRAAAGLRALGSAAQRAARAAAAAAGPAFARLAAVLRAVASAALRAALVIGGALRRALHSAADAARNLTSALLRWVAAVGPRMLAIFAALGPLIVHAVVALGRLLPLAMLLAPAALAAAASLATLKLGMAGVGDALKAGLSGDAEEFAKAMKKITPAAREFVQAVLAVRAGWRRMQQSIQEKLFVGLGDSLRNLVGQSLPFLERWLGKLATKFNAFGKEVMAGLVAPETMQQLDVIFAGIDSFIAGALRSVKALGRAFLDIAEAASPAFAELGADMGNAAEKFAGWIRMLKDDGTLARWIETAKETFNQLKEIGAELGRVFSAIFKGTDSKGFLESLKNSIKSLADWLHSDSGQSVIQWFGDVGSAIAGVIKWIAEVVAWFKKGWDAFRKDTEGLRNSLTTAFGAIGTAFGALMAVFGGGAAAFGWIPGVLGRLGGLVIGIQNAVSAINAALGRIKSTVFIDIITRNSTQGFAKPINSGGGGGGSAKFRAAGGPVTQGQPYIVGEKRAELFVPNQSGRIIPSLAGMGGTSVNLSMPTNAANTLVREFVRNIRVDIRRSAGGNAQKYWGSSGRL